MNNVPPIIVAGKRSYSETLLAVGGKVICAPPCIFP
jgi:hypothetical protein